MQGAVQVSAIESLVTTLYQRAGEFREDFGDEGRAKTLEWAACKLEKLLYCEADRVVALDEAASISGYTTQHIARLVRDGKIPDLRKPGSRGRIQIRASDLPIKPTTKHLPNTDVHGLASRLLGAKEA